nr:SLC13 family permease [Anaerolineae bacterium]
MWIALIILVGAIVLFVIEWLRVDLVAIGVVVALMLSGLLTVQESLAGFSSTAVITIAALFVVGGAMFYTGIAQVMGERLLRIAGTNETRLIVVIVIAVAFMSAFISDTGVVAVMLPAVISLTVTAKIAPSKLLLPLAIGSLLGGATTLIGTPPNIIIADLLRDSGLTPFGFFSYTPMGILIMIVGILFMAMVGRRLLPAHVPHRDVQSVETAEELIALYRLPDNLFRLRVRHNSPLVNQTIAESGLGQRFLVTVIRIVRPTEPQMLARLGEQRILLQPDEQQIHDVTDVVVQPDDILVVQGDGNAIAAAAALWNLAVQPASTSDQESLVTDEIGIAEVLLPPRSALIGKTLPEIRFGTTYRLTVLDIRRPGEERALNLKQTTLQFGDTLLVQGEWKNIQALKSRRRDFIVMGEPQGVSGGLNRKRAPIALLVLLGMLVLIVTGITSVATASLVAALAMVLTGCLTMDEAYESVNWKSIVLVAGMLPMATALEQVGLVNLVADGFVDVLGDFGPRIVMMGLFLLTTLFTQVLSNTATAVLIAPVALATANRLGINPYAFLMAVAIAASTAYVTPVASPVNTLVMGAGNYRFIDYAKIGIPLVVVVMLFTMVALPFLWPF